MTDSQTERATQDASGVAGGEEVQGVANEARKSPLTLYPKHPAADDVYFIGGAWAPAAITATDKRFTDAELAAEYWRKVGDYDACMDGYSTATDGYNYGTEGVEGGRLVTLHRFATLPHHDQEPS